MLFYFYQLRASLRNPDPVNGELPYVFLFDRPSLSKLLISQPLHEFLNAVPPR